MSKDLSDYKVLAADLHRKNTLLEINYTKLQNRISELEKTIDGSELLYNKQTNVITALQSSLKEKEKDVKHWVSVWENQSDHISKQQEQIEELKAENERLKKELEDYTRPNGIMGMK